MELEHRSEMTGTGEATERLCDYAWLVASGFDQEAIPAASAWAMVSGVYEEVKGICGVCYRVCHSCGRPFDLVMVVESVLGCCCTVFSAVADFVKARKKYCVVFASAVASASG